MSLDLINPNSLFLKFLAGYMYNQYKESQKNQNFIFLA
ncbi:hypothetical protein SCODD09_01317 [Streptococcus constellatus]|nr:hypothetical protein SCODD09_01317 [Streptococcus constellatus]